jgi:hypothetical protein
MAALISSEILSGCFPALTAPVWTPKVGEIVENFGQIARVLEIDAERGLLLRAMPNQGFEAGADKWHADADKCRPVR